MYHDYYHLKENPFNVTADPDFFFFSKSHAEAISLLCFGVEQRKGILLVTGEIGTGKTTLSRKLLHELNKRGDMIFHMILDPAFTNENQFLSSLVKNFNIELQDDLDLRTADIVEMRDAIERFLIQKTLEENRTIILVIDEAQKMDLATLETLRILLNFETNEHKLIQLVLLGQLELYSKVVHMSNFMDRISFKFTLNPLDVYETYELILFRMMKAGYQRMHRLFLDDALSDIYNYSRGYPRKINMLCHKILKYLVLINQNVVDARVVKEVIVKDQQWISATRQNQIQLSQVIEK